MISFENDYSTGAHPLILEALAATNLEPASGYGTDRFCASAAERIRTACDAPEADVFFLTGGTQTNAVVLSALLPSWAGVVCADTGHIAVHEAGAIEATGHKVLTLPEHGGKLDAAELEGYLVGFFADGNHEHMVFPGAVFIAHPSELGTLYSLAELEQLRAVCDRYDLPLYLDGARLGYGLAACDTDVTLPDIARLTDVFYIGGTKGGALCGEAVVFPRGTMPAHFLTHVKQQGALLAKGRLLGVQFDTLFAPAASLVGTDSSKADSRLGAEDAPCSPAPTLYEAIARNAIDRARDLVRVLTDAGCSFFRRSPTNQQFVILENDVLEALAQQVRFSFWERYDDTRTVVRFVTSWSTTPEDIVALEAALRQTLHP